MRFPIQIVAASAVCLLASCSGGSPPAASKTAAPAANTADPVRITQFYATHPKLAKGTQELLCYGVENSTRVWLEPPRQELSNAIARCVEVTPAASTTYVLTAEGASGPPATQKLTVTLGAPPAKIVDVTVSALKVRPGDLVSLCVRAENAESVEIAPIHFRSAGTAKACTEDFPRKTTEYVVTATGKDGDRDHERVTVQVQ